MGKFEVVRSLRLRLASTFDVLCRVVKKYAECVVIELKGQSTIHMANRKRCDPNIRAVRSHRVIYIHSTAEFMGFVINAGLVTKKSLPN